MFKTKAYAKFNLNLNVLPQKLKSGYSEIKTINCQLSLADDLIFEKKEEKIGIFLNRHAELVSASQTKVKLAIPKLIRDDNNLIVQDDESNIPLEENTIYKAAVLLKKAANNLELGISIKLIKHIPIKSGLGGESTDAAITLLSLNKLWQLNYPLEKLQTLAGQLGSDLYYCLKGGACEVSGYGEKVVSIAVNMPEIWGIIINPSEVKQSVKWAYDNLDRSSCGQNLDKLAKIKEAMKKKNKKEIIDNLFNEFENLLEKNYPVLIKIKKDLKETGVLNSLVAGSGLAVVGFFENKLLAQEAQRLLAEKYKQTFLIKTI